MQLVVDQSINRFIMLVYDIATETTCIEKEEKENSNYERLRMQISEQSEVG